MSLAVRSRLAALAVATLAAGSLSADGDPGAAADRYRVARRLAAEHSPQAAQALEQVIELDPGGPLADDALLDMARLEGAAEWPEELGQLTPEAGARALTLLERLVEQFPGGDRAAEARLALALSLLEPLGQRDAARARVELLELATATDSGDWGLRARYVIAWLDELQGSADRANAAYQRLFLDGHAHPVAGRAAAGTGRSFLQLGAFRPAAVWLQQAVELGAPETTLATALRELAVRGMLARSSAGRGWTAGQTGRVNTGLRAPEWIVRLADGDRVVADRKSGVVIRYAPHGDVVRRWSLEEIQALNVGPLGRVFVAADTRVYLLAGDAASPVAQQGDLGPVSALAVDGQGAVWLADRKGERVGRISPDGTAPTTLWQSKSARISGLAWNGATIVGIDGRGGGLLALSPDGSTRAHGSAVFQKPVSIAALPVGVLAVLDNKSGTVTLLGAEGQTEATIPVSRLGVAKPAGLALGFDGSLDVLDAAGGSVVTAP